MCFFRKYKINRLIKKLKPLHQSRALNQPSEEAIKKEISYYNKLARIFLSLRGNKKYPFAKEMAIACYKASATLEDAEGAYLVGKYLLEEAKFRENIQNGGLFSNSSNERNMKQLYEEALAYLQAAEKLNHILAKRLHGLCYINGWGVTPDKKHGFDLVVASIDQENAWAKVPQIFAAIGLNKPEFFSALAQHRNKT